MVKLRSSAVCTVCSGRGSAALDKGKLRVSEDTCSEFIQTCFDSWTMLIQIMNGMKRGKEIADKLQGTIPSLTFPYRGQFVDAMAAWLQATSLERNLAQCGDSQTCPTAAKIGICGAVLNVEQATFLEDSLELVLKGRKSATAAEVQGFDKIKTPFKVEQPSPATPPKIQPASKVSLNPSNPINQPNQTTSPPPVKSGNFGEPTRQANPQQPPMDTAKTATNPKVQQPQVASSTSPAGKSPQVQSNNWFKSLISTPQSVNQYLIYDKSGAAIGFRTGGWYYSVSQ
jgi:hypothetical protein